MLGLRAELTELNFESDSKADNQDLLCYIYVPFFLTKRCKKVHLMVVYAFYTSVDGTLPWIASVMHKH